MHINANRDGDRERYGGEGPHLPAEMETEMETKKECGGLPSETETEKQCEGSSPRLSVEIDCLPVGIECKRSSSPSLLCREGAVEILPLLSRFKEGNVV